MATYKQFEAYLKKNLKVIQPEDAPKGFMALNYALPKDRSHMVFVAPGPENELFGPTATLIAPIGELTAKQVDTALTMCSNLLYGLVKIGEYVYVKTTLLLENIDENEIHIPLNMICWNADILEGKILGQDRY